MGEPIPTISWYFDGTMINVSDTSKYSVSNSTNGNEIISLFTIMSTQSSNAGIYTCEAKNFLGVNRSFGILTVNGKYLVRSRYFILIVLVLQMPLKSLNQLGEKQNTLRKEIILHLDV